MARGQLRVSGKMDLAQFWPAGQSDGDTITVQVTAKSFFFSRDPATTPFKNTSVFQNATVKGRGTRPAIRNSKITIRLQGIDATELHSSASLRPGGLKDNGTRFRQFFGETATVKLHDFAVQAGKGTIPCDVVTAVDCPNDVVDTFGRFIGGVLITVQGEQVELEHLMVRKQVAFPC